MKVNIDKKISDLAKCVHMHLLANAFTILKLYIYMYCSSELSCCFAEDKIYRWIQKSLATKFAMSFDCKVTTPIVMHSGHRYIRQVAQWPFQPCFKVLHKFWFPNIIFIAFNLIHVDKRQGKSYCLCIMALDSRRPSRNGDHPMIICLIIKFGKWN
jgi:hypothetical protein